MVPTVRSAGNADNTNLNGDCNGGDVVTTAETEMEPLHPNPHEEASQDFGEADAKVETKLT